MFYEKGILRKSESTYGFKTSEYLYNNCEHNNIEIRKFIFDCGVKQYVKQCIDCGRKLSNAIKKEIAIKENNGKEPLIFDKKLFNESETYRINLICKQIEEERIRKEEERILWIQKEELLRIKIREEGRMNKMNNINYSIKPIETYYKGILFRSRLEAKWAAMFDLLEWRWDYEPIDFNGWIPDFVIYGKPFNIYVEVKPVTTFPKDVANKLSTSGCKDELLIVGSTCLIPGSNYELVFGWTTDLEYSKRNENSNYSSDDSIDDSIDWFGESIFGRWEDGNGQIGFCHAEAMFNDRISGGYDGGRYGCLELEQEEIKYLWGLAHNKTRWIKSN